MHSSTRWTINTINFLLMKGFLYLFLFKLKPLFFTLNSNNYDYRFCYLWFIKISMKRMQILCRIMWKKIMNFEIIFTIKISMFEFFSLEMFNLSINYTFLWYFIQNLFKEVNFHYSNGLIYLNINIDIFYKFNYLIQFFEKLKWTYTYRWVLKTRWLLKVWLSNHQRQNPEFLFVSPAKPFFPFELQWVLMIMVVTPGDKPRPRLNDKFHIGRGKNLPINILLMETKL